jgi:hypothetical protein
VPKIDLVFFDAGGGHRSAANALKLVIERQHRPWDVHPVNLQEILDPLDLFRKLLGLRLQDVYNFLLKRGWTLGSTQLLRPMHAVIRLYHRPQVRLLQRFWSVDRPDIVVSLVPNFNRALAESLKSALPATPFVTVLTDLADYTPHFWLERESEYVVCASDMAVAQARALGLDSDHILRVSGMILHPSFYERAPVDRAAERRRLGLDPDRPTGLVLFGGQGSSVMLEIYDRLERSDLDVQLILICGRNRKLSDRLRARRGRLAKYVEGFTTEIPYYMALSDFFIGKPGPGSISEALAMRLPVIVERNAWTLPQERFNADWVLEQGVGLVLRNFRGIEGAVRELLDPARFARCRERAAAIRNRAVFEIPDLLAGLLPREAAPPPPARHPE